MRANSVYYLDACAFIAALNGEEGADIVKGLLVACNTGEITIFMSTAQVLEVYYDRIYTVGQERADDFLANIGTSKIVIDRYVSDLVIIKAGHYKTSFQLSFADSLCLATAFSKSAIVITCDHKEFDPVEEAERFPFLWIRPPKE